MSTPPNHSFRRTAVVLTALLLASNPSSGQDGTGPGTEILAGAARVNITPGLPVTLAGYESRTQLSTGVHDSLFARAIAFESGASRLVIVSTDILGFYNDTAEPIRDAIVRANGLDASELFLTSIHTHAGPVLGLDSTEVHPNNVTYTATLRDLLVEVVGEALDAVGPASLQIGTGSSPVGVNRRQVYRDELDNPRVWLGRNPDGVHNRQVQVLHLASAEGPDGILFNHAVHSTSLGPANLLMSGDVHGIAEGFVERYLGPEIVAAAFAGASGDIDPWFRVRPGFQTEKGWVPEAVLMGTMLGEEVAFVTERLEPVDLGGGVASSTDELSLPGKPRGALTAQPDSPDTPLAIGVARIGDVGLVCLGGEILTEVGSAIESASPFSTTFILSHCNGASGYLPPGHLYHLGGYEVESATFGPAAANQLVREITARLHALANPS